MGKELQRYCHDNRRCEDDESWISIDLDLLRKTPGNTYKIVFNYRIYTSYLFFIVLGYFAFLYNTELCASYDNSVDLYYTSIRQPLRALFDFLLNTLVPTRARCPSFGHSSLDASTEYFRVIMDKGEISEVLLRDPIAARKPILITSENLIGLLELDSNTMAKIRNVHGWSEINSILDVKDSTDSVDPITTAIDSLIVVMRYLHLYIFSQIALI